MAVSCGADGPGRLGRSTPTDTRCCMCGDRYGRFVRSRSGEPDLWYCTYCAADWGVAFKPDLIERYVVRESDRQSLSNAYAATIKAQGLLLRWLEAVDLGMSEKADHIPNALIEETRDTVLPPRLVAEIRKGEK